MDEVLSYRHTNIYLVLIAICVCALAGQLGGALHAAEPILAPLRIIDSIPQPDAGIMNQARVPEDTSFAVLIESEYGIDLNDPDSIRFTIDDEEHTVYGRNLKSPEVRLVEVDSANPQTTLLWATYDRSLDTNLPPTYALDTYVYITVDVVDLYGNELASVPFEFKIESDAEQADAYDEIPEFVHFTVYDPMGIHDTGIQIVSGPLSGAKVIYDSDEPLSPAFGPVNEIETIPSNHADGVGMPLNLLPHTVFDTPVKLFIPFPKGKDIRSLDIFYHNGVEWLAACDADGNVLSGGKGWMVPESRVNHVDHEPPLIEIQVVHFSAAQGGVVAVSEETDGETRKSGGSGAAVLVSCFIDSAAAEGMPMVGIIGLLSLLGLLLPRVIGFRFRVQRSKDVTC
jgi:hypothetical protein